MTYMLNSIEDAVDRKFLVLKSVSGQVPAGTLIHVMDARQEGGKTVIYYRSMTNGRDGMIKFDNPGMFYKWARPDNFIARYYDRFSNRDIQQYIKLSSRTFKSFCLPLMIAAIILVWVVCLLFFPVPNLILKVVVGVCLSVMVGFAVWSIYKNHHTKVMMRLYRNVSADWAGGGLVIR